MENGFKYTSITVLTSLLVIFSPQMTASQQPELTVQTSHSNWIQTVTFSPDGMLVATGGGDGTIKVWDVRTGRELRTIFGHLGTKPLEFEQDQNLAESKDWAVDIFETTHGHRAIYSLAFSPDGKLLASGSTDRTIKLWDSATGKPMGEINQPVRVWFIAFNDDGTKLLSVGSDDSYRYWDIATRQEIKADHPPETSFRLPWISPNKNLVARYSEKDTTIKIVDLATNQQRILQGHSAGVRRVVFSPNGETLASCGWDRTVRLWDLEGQKETKILNGYASFVSSVAFTPDGKQLASVGGDLTIKLWDARSGEEIETLRGYSLPQLPLSLSKDNKTLITASDNIIHVWNLVKGHEVGEFQAHSGAVEKAALSPDNNILATSDIRDYDLAEIAKWNPSLIKSLPDNQGTETKQPDSDNVIRLWDLKTLRLLRELRGHTGKGITALAFDDGGETLASAGMGLGIDSTVRIWDLVNDRNPTVLKTGTGIISALAFSPNKKILAGGSFLGAISLWDTASGREFTPFPKKHTAEVFLIGFSKDGNTLISFSKDNTARVWDVPTAKLKDSVRYDTSGWVGKIYDYAPDFINNLPLLIKKNSRFTILPDANGRVEVHDAQNNALLAWLIALREGDWAVVAPNGRFDTNQLEGSMGLSWISPDAPFTPLPLDIFMRDYYEPRLLPRILSGEEFPELPSLVELNRNQPKVQKITIIPQVSAPSLVTVKVEVASVLGQCLKDGNQVSCESGVYDLRLYRDGQLVGQSPAQRSAPSADGRTEGRVEQFERWRRTHVVKAAGQPITTATGPREIAFNDIRLPQRRGVSKVEFTAYAFNKDRVKSSTSEPVLFNLSKPRAITKRRAYVITIGVDATTDPSLRLSFAPKGAREIEHLLREKLGAQYDVTNVALISEYNKNISALELSGPTKNNIKAVLGILAGKTDPVAKKREFRMLRSATPDDLVVIYLASHGYADPQGMFYVVPSDIGEPAGVSEQLIDRCLKTSEQSDVCRTAREFLHRSISSDELTQWLQPIYAGQIVLILDSCHSAAVSGRDFKPGPMGDRGFGQLAYDKGMLMLTATQAENVDWGTLELRDLSLLGYALTNQQPEEPGRPFDLADWLQQTESQVPELYRRFVKIEEQPNREGRHQQQEPELFDFTRKNKASANK